MELLTITPTTGLQLSIDSAFSDNKTTINNRTYYLGMDFTTGVASPEVKQHSGNIIYVDNRPSITRSSNQRRHKSYLAVLKNYATADEPQRSTIF